MDGISTGGSKRDSSEGQKRGVGTPMISLGSVLVENSLCPGQEKRMIHKPEIQIGNSGWSTKEESHCTFRFSQPLCRKERSQGLFFWAKRGK